MFFLLPCVQFIYLLELRNPIYMGDFALGIWLYADDITILVESEDNL